jgi:hypothetical protein
LLKILRDLSKRLGPQFQQPEGYQRKLYAFTREALLGIRAAYDVVRLQNLFSYPEEIWIFVNLLSQMVGCLSRFKALALVKNRSKTQMRF